MTTLPKIYVFRPTELAHDCAGVAFDENGNQLAWHVSSDIHFFRSDMGLNGDRGIGATKHEKYRERYPEGYELEEVIGSWRDHPVMGTWADDAS